MQKALSKHKNYTLFALTFLSLLGILAYHSQVLAFTKLLVIVLVTLILEFALTRYSNKTPSYEISISTALIIFLLADPTSKIYQIFIAIFASNLIMKVSQSKNLHIINPAALGLVVASLFGLSISWWGFIPGIVSSLLIISLISFTNPSVRDNLRTIISFLLTTLILSYLSSFDLLVTVTQFLIGGFWFFTLILLPEENTLAHLPRTKYILGATVASLSFLLPRIGIRTDPLLTSLLLGNFVLWYLVTKKNFRKLQTLKFLFKS